MILENSSPEPAFIMTASAVSLKVFLSVVKVHITEGLMRARHLIKFLTSLFNFSQHYNIITSYEKMKNVVEDVF